MSKIHIVLLLCLTFSLSLPHGLAVPSLLCIPNSTAPIQISNNRKQDQAAIRRIRVYYVNGHSEWEAKALIIGDQVKAIIFKTNQRPVIRSKIDSSGFGSGVDFRGQPWEFHGFLDPWIEISTIGHLKQLEHLLTRKNSLRSSLPQALGELSLSYQIHAMIPPVNLTAHSLGLTTSSLPWCRQQRAQEIIGYRGLYQQSLLPMLRLSN